MAITAIPILPVKSISGNQFRTFRIIEDASQTFKLGTPVIINSANGAVKVWVANTQGPGPGGIAGIATEAASNLATAGAGAPSVPYGDAVIFPGAAAGTFGSVPNESAAKNIAHGAPFNDGRIGFHIATTDTLWSATFGNAGNGATPANTDVGKQYGLSLDTGGNFWYVDQSKVTAGTNTVLTVVSLDLRDSPASATRVVFQFLASAVNLLG